MKQKNIAFRLLLCLLSFFMVSSVFCACNNAEKNDESETGFHTIFRMAVASDVHIKEYECPEEERLAGMMNEAYAYADSATDGYNNLDAFIFAGDVADRGQSVELDKFFNICRQNIRGETALLAIPGNHEFYTDASNTLSRFEASYGASQNQHTVINGIHIITLSPSNGSGYARTTSGEASDRAMWLRQELDKAEADVGYDMPIFVAVHQPPQGTVYGSEQTWGITDLTEVFSDYSNVVVFAGHSHFPILDNRSQWQGDYTVINTGTLSYYELGLNGVSCQGIFTTDFEGGYGTSGTKSAEAGNYYIVEVSDTGLIRLTGYNLVDGYNLKLFVRYLSPKPTEFQTEAVKKYLYPAVEFPDGADLQIDSVHCKSLAISIPNIPVVDDIVPESYRVYVYEGDNLVKTAYALTDNYLGYYDLPTTVKCTITGLSPGTSYHIEVYAVNPYGKLSQKCLTTDATTLESSQLEQLVQITFDENGTIEHITGDRLKAYGTASTVYDETIGQYVGVFDASQKSAYRFCCFADYYEELTQNITLEALFMVTKAPENYGDVIANTQYGGISFEYRSDNRLQFWMGLDKDGGNQYTIAEVDCPTGEWIHAVATYDGSDMKLYINGELKTTIHAPGTIHWQTTGSDSLYIGADTGSGDWPEAYLDARVAFCNVYATCKSSEDVTVMYRHVFPIYN